MALIGLGAATVVAIVAYVRSDRGVNKAGVAGMWAGFAALSAGIV